MTAYYNEIDKFAAQTLRNLIAAGHIAPGDVDERSIEDVLPSDLRGYTQCHFFAGIGVWSHALRQAGWSDDRSVWSGSCPCQPFSAAGQGAGFDDERHLWPAFHHLIKECKPAAVLGEQVASKDADPWIDLVHADLEALGYAFGCVPFPSAGVGAPHIRDRNYWVANSQCEQRRQISLRGHQQVIQADVREQATELAGNSGLGRLAHHNGDGCEPWREGSAAMGHGQAPGADCGSSILGNTGNTGNTGLPERECITGVSGGAPGGIQGEATERAGIHAVTRPGPTNGLWADADWLFCRDGKWRPVEPGTFPLVNGAPARVGRLRGYGNAINAIQAQTFIEAVMEAA